MFPARWCCGNGMSTCKRMKLDPYLAPCVEILKMEQRPKLTPETTTFLGEKHHWMLSLDLAVISWM